VVFDAWSTPRSLENAGDALMTFTLGKRAD
jgi:hypothetical protein